MNVSISTRGRSGAGLALAASLALLFGCGGGAAPDPGADSSLYMDGNAQSNKVTVAVMGGPLERNAEPQELHLRVTVPQNHHGYLNEGDEGFYVPFAFSFDELQSAGAEVEMVALPEGTREEELGATILRGDGEFSFRVEGLAADASSPLSASLRYQICNDMTGLCYRPEEVRFEVANGEGR